MQVKKFIGESTASVMALIKKEFGEDAIILQTNKIKTGGFLGFFQKEEIEIIAALDNESRVDTRLRKNIQKKQPINNDAISDRDFKSHINNMNEIRQSKMENHPIENSLVSKENKNIEIKRDDANKNEAKEVKKDIDEIKNTVKELSKKINDTFRTPQEEEEYIKEQEEIAKLNSTGISLDLSKEIVTNVKKSGKNISYDSVCLEIEKMLSNSIKINYTQNKKYIIFIGSTGVGKTTTLAKIASKEAMEKRKKIGFLTLDTYRISAVEQLKTYAEILSSPIEIAYEIRDLVASIDRLSNRDLVFIDTAGRSHNNKGQVDDIKNVLKNIENKKVYLVLSANINMEDMFDIIETYNFVDDYEIIVTKMDETKRHGNLLNLMMKTGKKISYTAFGQNVPDDIEEFRINTYISELVREIY
ncbi:MAG: flagellar biosynthesis protein FlhF [Peptostreptococcaceae bacterium]|jgi:flagellar biosynthesis protein flhF|nr:flagellar biosynthesis protein FlhF [Peptostreptococcaceae bacterium]